MAEQTTQIYNQGTGGTVPVDLSIISSSASAIPASGLGPNLVARQNVCIGDVSASGSIAGVNIYGSLNTVPTRRSLILTTTPLTAGATFTSAWYDVTIGMETALSVFGFQTNGSSLNIAYPNFYIQTTDDTSNSNTLNFGGQINLNNNTISTMSCELKQRYWRVVLLNSTGVNLTSLEITANLTTNSFQSTLFDPVSQVQQTIHGYANSDGNYPPGIGAMDTAGVILGYNGATANGLDRIRSCHTGHLVTTTSPTKSRVIFNVTNFTPAGTSEAGVALSLNTAGVSSVAASAYTVPAGYTLRLTNLRTSTYAATGSTFFRLRLTSLTGLIEWGGVLALNATTANPTVDEVVFPDGVMEYPAGAVLVFTIQAQTSTSQRMDYQVIGYIFKDPF